MSTVTTTTNKVNNLKLDLSGHLVVGPSENKNDHILSHEKIGNKSHHYYRQELSSILGPDGIVSGYDLVASGLMAYFVKGAAPLTNFFISLAEYMQVLIAKTKLLGNPDASGKEGEIAKQRRVGAMGWIQVLAGVGGLVAFANDIRNDDDEKLALNKKIGLSVSMLASAGALFTTYIEKILVIATSKGKKVGNEISGIFLNAHNDLRAVSEYIVMAVYPWIKQVQPIKKLIDFVVPVLALRDGLGSFLANGISKVFTKELNIKVPDKPRRFLKRLFFINGEFEDPIKNVKVPGIIGNELVMGKNGLRSMYAPIYKALGCKNFPELELKNGDGEKLLHVAA